MATTVVAHGAGSTLAPENTLPAIQNAFALGSDWVEVDVRFTADAVAVLMHDETVDRTTNGTGLLASLTLAQVQLLDAGSHFAPEYAGTPVPSLQETLSATIGNGIALIDIKEPGAAQAVAALLIQLGADPRGLGLERCGSKSNT